MRLVDLDKIDMTGATIVRRFLDKWEKEHPITEIVVREDSEWTVIMKRKTKA